MNGDLDARIARLDRVIAREEARQGRMKRRLVARMSRHHEKARRHSNYLDDLRIERNNLSQYRDSLRPFDPTRKDATINTGG